MAARAFSGHGTCRWPQGWTDGPPRDPDRVTGNAARPRPTINAAAKSRGVVAHGPADLERTERITAPDPPGLRDRRLLVRILDDRRTASDHPRTCGDGTVDRQRRRPCIDTHRHRLAF